MADRAEFYIHTDRALHFYASWPTDADPRELRGVAGALPAVLNYWAATLEEKASGDGEAEYASWSLPDGVLVDRQQVPDAKHAHTGESHADGGKDQP